MLLQSQSTKEIFDFVSSFSGDDSDPWSHGHPVQAVPHFLANPNEESRTVSLKQLEMWYAAYTAKRGLTTFKRPESIVWASKLFNQLCYGKSIKTKSFPYAPWSFLAAIRLWTAPWRRTLSKFRLQRWSHFTQQLNLVFGCYLIWVLAIIAEIILLIYACHKFLWVNYMWASGFHGPSNIISQTIPRFSLPSDGLPCLRDWQTCFESIMVAGIDLGREPISVNASSWEPVWGICKS